MNLFTKLFFPTAKDNNEASENEILEELKLRFDDEAEFYSKVVVFNKKQQNVINYMMIHPQAGVVLFNFFNYCAADLDGVTASFTDNKSSNADIKTTDAKQTIQLRFEEVFHTQIAPVRSILICPNLNEGEFDYLDESFQHCIPKNLVLFNDSPQQHYEDVILGKEPGGYDTDKIKKAIFSEFILPEQNILMSKEQQTAVHTDFSNNLNIKGLPGSGKSSVLIAKALYEKMKDPRLDMIIFGRLPCNVHHLQSLIFQCTEHAHWSLNPAEITVSSFESIKKRISAKEKFDLVVCDEINTADLSNLKRLLNKKGRLLLSSCYEIDDITSLPLLSNYRLSSALCAACEGHELEDLSQSLSLKIGNTFMNTLLVLEQLLPNTPAQKISILHYNKEELLRLQNEINEYFTPIAFLFDDQNIAKDSILLHPLEQISCIDNDYVIAIIEDAVHEELIQLISRGKKKSFILSENDNVNHLIQHIKGKNNETD